ncbi:carboxypeptidase regulatory-like domain-containing protein, partial [bacterium]|nr:carboxypeptidase regulatory-like domain-containing protein [bacterium]
YPAKELLVGGNYQWRVAAVDAASREVQSEYRKFVYDIPVALVDVFTYDGHGTQNFTDDEKLPRTNIEYLTMNGVPAGLSLATDLHANLYDVQMAPGTYIFIASKEGYAAERDTVTLAAGDDIQISFRLSLNPALVHGRVLDETGVPIVNADVSCMHTLLNDLIYLFQTDAAGYFNAVLPAGTWRLLGKRTGYKNSRIVNLTVHTGEEITLPEPLVLERIRSRISGKIINANNQPVSGATISVSHQDISISMVSDAAGLFALSVLPGTWAVAVQKDGYAVPPVFEITVGDGQQYTLSPSITLTPNAGYVRGMVTDGQKIMADVVVRAIPPAGGFIQTTTDDFGQFSLNLTTGNYQLMALLAGYENAVGPQINISSGQTVAGIVLVLTPMAGQISGKATTDGTTPLADVKISNQRASTFTSTNGTYVLQLPSGSTVLSSTLSGYLAEADQTVSLAPGQMLENINFNLAPNASVFKGNVLSGTDALAGAGVTAEMGAAVFQTLTDDAGAFVLSVSAGIWTIRATKNGFLSQSLPAITIGPGQTLVNLAFDLPTNSASLSGIVKNAQDKPVPEATVQILATGIQTTTQSDGSFHLTLEPGDYQVQAFKKGDAPSPIKDISLTAGGTLSNVMLKLVRGFRLSGKISDSAGAPVPAAIIVSNQGQQTASLTDGSYSLYLPYGTHIISVSKPGYSSAGGAEIEMWQERSDVNFILT